MSGASAMELRSGRKRRIKCDETKPYCKKCISTGRWCKGYDAPDSDQSDGAADLPQKDQNKHIELMKQSANTVIQYHGPNNIPAEPMPPDWDFIEGFRYCLSTSPLSTQCVCG